MYNEEFPWEEQFLQNENVNEQVKIFTDTVLNVMSNFVPNEVKQFSSRDAPWIYRQLKKDREKK